MSDSLLKRLGQVIAVALILGTFVFVAGLIWHAIRWAWAA